jgi:hypothetical protein
MSSSSDSASGSIIFASTCAAFSLYSSLKHSREETQRHREQVVLSSPPIHVHSKCEEGDITLHQIQNLSELIPSANIKNSDTYFHLLKSDDYVMGK